MFLGTVGFESPFNTQRFTFDQQWLLGGAPLVPVVIGLFAMSQAFVLLGTDPRPRAEMSEALIIVIFAIIGRFMLRNGILPFPLVIGLVLGPLLELRMKQSLSLSSGDPSVFLTRPIAATLMGLSAAAIFLFTISRIRAGKPQA